MGSVSIRFSFFLCGLVGGVYGYDDCFMIAYGEYNIIASGYLIDAVRVYLVDSRSSANFMVSVAGIIAI